MSAVIKISEIGSKKIYRSMPLEYDILSLTYRVLYPVSWYNSDGRLGMKLRERLFLLSGGVYGKLGNVYAVRHDSGYILIDCGRYDALEIIRKNMAYWTISEQEITHVLLTHGHDDHAGSSSWFQSMGARIYVGAGDETSMIAGNFGEESPFTNHVMPPCHPDICIQKDMDISVGGLLIHALCMPGHTDGSVLYHLSLDGEEVLFSGDMFFADGETGEAAFTGWKGDRNYNGIRLLDSFQKLWKLNLHPDIVAGGHGIPVIGRHADQIIMLAYKYAMLNNR